MELLQPILLWGALAAIIPVLIHLWYSRKGKPLPWAAMRWLSPKEQQPQKGFKPDHLFLLFLRILMLLVVVFILSKPFFPGLEKDNELPSVHLVEPDAALVEEFRFELEQAMEKGDQLYWMSESSTPITSLEEAEDLATNRSALPEFLSEQVEGNQDINLYIRPEAEYLNLPVLVSPSEVNLFVSEQPSEPQTEPFIAASDELFLILNSQGELEQTTLQPTTGETAFEGPITYKIELQDSMEVKHIEASLQAIEAVYGLEFQAISASEDSTALLLFADTVPKGVDKAKLVLVSDRIGQSLQPNTYFLPAPLSREENNLVRTGRLPEFILDKLLQTLDMSQQQIAVSKSQLEKMFRISAPQKTQKEANAITWLIVLLCMVIIVERTIALRKGI
ncbi:BatA domain-containing protein [Litoribacter populi]|uniref:BatA domain-containing protein n=1 Tax=Litoribacter populi TaxID=2598460 RepID=UPI00117E31C8|nr:BatA domain-containing protein [Litoribacter populi]